MMDKGTLIPVQEYEALLDNMPEPIGLFDHNFKILRYNPAGYALIGKPPEEVDKKKCWQVFGKEQPCCLCVLKECYLSRELSLGEEYFKDVSKWFHLAAHPIFDENGKVKRIFLHYRDITATKKIELKLLMLERALNHSIDGIAVADMEGYNQFVNPAWAQIHGYSADEMIGKNLYSFHPEEQLQDNVIPFFNKVFENGSHQGESEHTKKDGTLFATLMMASVIKTDSGKPIGFVGTIRDISELKLAQKKLEIHKNNLEYLVEDRTRELKAKNEALKSALGQINKLKEQLEEDNIQLREQIHIEHDFEEIIGQSDPLKYVLYRIGEVAPTDATTLILGQSGTGKELVARAIHNNSARSSRPMVKVDCSALPGNLIESELFGHEKGSFSGAHQQRRGRFELANGSTIFLDEIGELEPGLQSKFLRVLEYGEFERLGSSKTLRIDVRIIAATNRNLQEEVEKGRFREDLWFRLNVFTLKVPPLKARRDDIPLLVESFVHKFNRKHGKKITTVPKKTMSALMGYHWPGNIRELRNLIEAAIIVSRGNILRVADFPDNRLESTDKGPLTMAEMEKKHILRALESCNWQIEGNKGAAKHLDLNPGTLRGRMRKLDIKRPQD